MASFTDGRAAGPAGPITGGQPGRPPVTMIGSLFYRGQKLLYDSEKGLFDEPAARDLLQQEEELARIHNLPRIIDVIGETAPALRRQLEFVAANSRDPIMLDAADRNVRLQVLRELRGSPLIERLIYNSIDERVTAAELELLQQCGISRVVVLALGSAAVRPADRLQLLEGNVGLLARIAGCAFKTIMIDTGVLDLASIGWSALTIARVKEKLSHPVGCAPCNGFYLWARQEKPDPQSRIAVAATALSLPLAWGADFLFYGSLANAPWTYPAVQAARLMLAYAAREVNREKENGLPERV